MGPTDGPLRVRIPRHAANKAAVACGSSVSEVSSQCMVWYGMVWYGAPPTPWTAIVATGWWQLDRAPAEHAQTESILSALVRRWVSFPQGQAPTVAELRACAIFFCLERQPPSSQCTLSTVQYNVLTANNGLDACGHSI
jgi:hypothetical protein